MWRLIIIGALRWNKVAFGFAKCLKSAESASYRLCGHLPKCKAIHAILTVFARKSARTDEAIHLTQNYK